MRSAFSNAETAHRRQFSRIHAVKQLRGVLDALANVLDAQGSGSRPQRTTSQRRRKAAFDLHALLVMRSARAWDVLASAGYGDEALIHVRTCLEVDLRGSRIAVDPTDAAARSFFETRKGSGKQKRAIDEVMSFNGFSKYLSQSAHGTFAAAVRAIDSEAPALEIGPKRDPAAEHTARLVTLCVLRSGARAADHDQIASVRDEVIDDLKVLSDVASTIGVDAAAANTDIPDSELTEALSRLPG